MKKNRRGKAFAIFIILAIIGIAIGAYVFYTSREDKKREIDDLLNNEMYLRVDYGIVNRESKLQEKNALLKRTEQDTNYYLFITKDNLLFTYYLDWFYDIDPLKGYNLEYKYELKEKQVNNIMEAIKENAVENLGAKVGTDYIPIYVSDDKDNKYNYIKKHDLQMIFQENDLMLDIYEK